MVDQGIGCKPFSVVTGGVSNAELLSPKLHLGAARAKAAMVGLGVRDDQLKAEDHGVTLW